jgi:hypothetical protein
LSETGRSLARYDPATDRVLVLRRLKPRDSHIALTPDGRYLVVQRRHRSGDGTAILRDLADGDIRRVSLPWGPELVDAGSRYVIYSADQADIYGHVVIDLLEDWAGFVPWLGPRSPA